jgi:hypothetical protein
MGRASSLYKKTNNLPHINSELVDTVVTYCLGMMSNNERTLENWKVGINTEETPDKSWICANHLEALQTKKYLIKERLMQDDNTVADGDETILYVYKIQKD